MKNFRHVQGALNLETIEAKPVFVGDEIRDLEVEKENRAKDIIEDFMIAANGAVARYLASKNFPSIRRVVRVPKRWDRIVETGQGARVHASGDPGFQGAGRVPRQSKGRPIRTASPISRWR